VWWFVEVPRGTLGFLVVAALGTAEVLRRFLDIRGGGPKAGA
jgi:hypothetical protein